MAQAVRWQRLGAGLPAKADLAAEVAVPQPAHETRQARHLRAVRQGDRAASGVAVVGPRDEGRGVLLDLLEMLARRRFEADVVRRPAAAQRVGVGIELGERRDDEPQVAQENPSYTTVENMPASM